MEVAVAPIVYQETRLSAELKSPELISELYVPAHSTSSFASRSSPKRRRIDQAPPLDEQTFATQHLASESSVHFRKSRNASQAADLPRAVYWRVLEDGKLLVLQNADLFQDSSVKKDIRISLRFEFEKPIRPGGIVFTEAEREGKADSFLVLFILCHGGELHTIFLHREAWIRANWLAESTDSWHWSCLPSAFSYRTPHRILAASETELWFSMADSGLIRLHRDPEHPASQWQETSFAQGGWKNSLRGLISWKNANLRFAGVDLDPKAAAQVALSPDGGHVWTICLDHAIRVWSIAEAKIVLTLDLAHDTYRDFEKPPPHLIDPSHLNLVHILPGVLGTQHEDGYTVVTYSPQTRQFKYLAVHDLSNPEHGIEKRFSEHEWTPPVEELTGSSIWSLDSFHIKPDHDGRKHVTHLWLLVRAGSRGHALHIPLDFKDRQAQLHRDWESRWSLVKSGLNNVSDLDASPDNPSRFDPQVPLDDGTGISDLWLSFFFYPGRFSDVTLETALVVYRRSLGQAATSARPSFSEDSKPLRVRMSETIGSTVILSRSSNDAPSFNSFQIGIAAQWQTFYGVVKDLHRQREAVMALSIDPDEDMPWLALADYVSPLRRTSESETLWHNRTIYADAESSRAESHLTAISTFKSSRNAKQVGKLFFALSILRKALSPAFVSTFVSAILSDVYSRPTSTRSDIDRLQEVYDVSGFSGQLSDEDYSKLTVALQPLGGFDRMTTTLFAHAVDYLSGELKGQHHTKRNFLRHGIQALVRGGQETISLGYEIVVDLLLLVVFMGAELEPSDLPEEFDAANAYSMLSAKFKQYDLLHWLLSNTCGDTISSVKSETRSPSTAATVHEKLFSGDLQSMIAPAMTQADLLTYYVRAWTLGMPLEEKFNFITPYIMTQLLKRGDSQQAASFIRFMPDELPWSQYVQGRFYIMSGQFGEAAYMLEAASADLGEHLSDASIMRIANTNSADVTVPISEIDTAQLLSLDEQNHFNNGKASYLQHVANLFEKLGAWSYVSEFASQAVNAIGNDHAARSDLLSRLYTSYIRTSRFRPAFETLTKYTDLALRKSAVRSLVSTLVLHPKPIPILLDLPFESYPSLSSEVDEELATLASKSPAPSTGSELSLPPSYYKIIYAWRIQRDDFRGAALIIWERLLKLKHTRVTAARYFSDEHAQQLEDSIAESYLTVINCLSLIEPKMAWMLVRPSAQDGQATASMTGKRRSGAPAEERRKIVTLEDVRRDWQAELDFRADSAAGRFPLSLEPSYGASGGMELDGDFSISGRGSMPGGMEVDVFAA